MAQEVIVASNPDALDGIDTLLVIGRKAILESDALQAVLPPSLPSSTWQQMLSRTEARSAGRSASTWLPGTPSKLVLGMLPENCSRHNSPTRAWAIPSLVRGARGRKLGVVLATDTPEHLAAMFMAAARALPHFDARTRRAKSSTVLMGFTPGGFVGSTAQYAAMVDAVRFTASCVDAPPSDMHIPDFLELAKQMAASNPRVTAEVIQGADLIEQELGGVYGVGRAAAQPPALLVLDYTPESPVEHVAWVGKGVIYDTGGLSLKSKTGMVGMKSDMGGAAAVLGAFKAAVALGSDRRITAVLGLVENAIGPNATRPDDILRMYSGRTVEVNNTDAEGRLVLADACAWVARNRTATTMVDLATLTGAQLVSTGKRHAALYTPDEDLENAAIASGKRSGDLVHPLPFAPEFFRPEFVSQVADMRNSVKDRSNAQSSCAGEFIRWHVQDWPGRWLHVDIAGPAVSGQRATGYGVGLLLGLVGLV